MVPNLDLQLQVAIKALTDVVSPAVSPSNKMATEQLGLTIATLQMVRDRLPISRRFARRSLEDALVLAEAVLATDDGIGGDRALASLVADVRVALEDPTCETDELEHLLAGINAGTCAVIAAAQDTPASRKIEIAVLNLSAGRIERGRSWCLPAGFEPNPEQIPPISSLI